MSPIEKPVPRTSVFLVGAQKSGTTTLHNLLAAHPDLYFPATPQEIHYFDLNYARGDQFYQQFFSEWSGQALVAQTSPLYLYLPAVASRIHDYCGEARIIIILRDPVHRAYSHYWHSVRYGFESLSFEDALAREPERLGSTSTDMRRRDHSYVDRGRYGPQVERYIERFGRSNVLVLGFEELRRNPLGVADRCFRFLELPEPAGSLPIERRNSSMRTRSRRVQRLRPLLDAKWGSRAGSALDRLNLRVGSYPPLDATIERALRSEFLSSDEQLAEILYSDAPRVITWSGTNEDA